jgi:hypothetical protein
MMNKSLVKVIDDIITEISRPAAEAWTAADLVRKKIVVKGDFVAPGAGNKREFMMRLASFGARFLQRAPLKGYISAPGPYIDEFIL